MSESLFLPGGLLTIFLVSAVTYGLRFGGLLLAGVLPNSGPVRRFLDALPGSILISLVVPAALQSGVAGMIGLGACLLAYLVTRNLLVTMGAGVVVVSLLRQGIF
ncbi:MAG: AzlD domain-containing protein [Thermodesulfobacteriota bacterium]